MINKWPQLPGPIKNESHKAVDRSEFASAASAGAALDDLRRQKSKYDNNSPYLNKAGLVSPTQTESQND